MARMSSPRRGAAVAPRWGLQRSATLLASFRYEQTDPVRHYQVVAEDFAATIDRWEPLEGRTVLDIGGGPGFYASAINARRARYVAVEHDLKETRIGDQVVPAVMVGDGMHLAVRSGSVDICCSSNVLEHVPHPWEMADEMIRVVRPGGVVVLTFTNWLSPHGGHETSPWHFIGGAYAARRYERRTGHPPQNRFGHSLYALSVRDALRWAHSCPDVEVVAAAPRYYPDWAAGLLRVPGLREVLSWNLLLVLRRHPAPATMPG